MRTTIQAWSSSGFAARLAIAILTGATWTISSGLLILLNPEYWDPVSVTDWVAVYSYGAAWLLTAVSLSILREVTRDVPTLSGPILVVSAGCAVAGVGNLMEDAVGISGFGSVYVLGVLVGGGGLIVLAAPFWLSPARSLTFVPAIGGLAAVTVVLGGGVLGLVAWVGFALVLRRERIRSAAASCSG